MSIPDPSRDSESVMLPDETESSLTDTLGVAETSEAATPRYSKRWFGRLEFSAHFSSV